MKKIKNTHLIQLLSGNMKKISRQLTGLNERIDELEHFIKNPQLVAKMTEDGMIKGFIKPVNIDTEEGNSQRGGLNEWCDECFVDSDGNAHMPAPKPKPRGPMLEAPDLGDTYYLLDCGGVIGMTWDNIYKELTWLAHGACFHTKEDAERTRDADHLRQKIREWIARDGWEPDWTHSGQSKASLFYDTENNRWDWGHNLCTLAPGVIYFNPDDFDALIKEFGDRLEVLL